MMDDDFETVTETVHLCSAHDIAVVILEGVSGMRLPLSWGPEEAMRNVESTHPEVANAVYRASSNVLHLIAAMLSQVHADDKSTRVLN